MYATSLSTVSHRKSRRGSAAIRTLLLATAVLFGSFASLSAQANGSNFNDDPEKKKLYGIIDLIESALGSPVVGGKSCLDQTLKSILNQKGQHNIPYEQTKPTGKPAQDTTLRQALKGLRDLIKNNRVRKKNLGGANAAVYQAPGTTGDLVLIDTGLFSKACGTGVAANKHKVGYKMILMRSLLNELAHVYQKVDGTFAGDCDSERDSDIMSKKILKRLIDAMESAPNVPHTTLAMIDADAEKVPGLKDFMMGCGAGNADIAKIHKMVRASYKQLCDRLTKIFNPPLSAAVPLTKQRWGNYYSTIPDAPFRYASPSQLRDRATIEDEFGNAHDFFPSSGLVVQAYTYMDPLDELCLAVLTYNAPTLELHFWRDTDGDLIPQPLPAAPVTALPGPITLADPGLEGAAMHDGMPAIFSAGGQGGLMIHNFQNGDFLGMEYGANGLPTGALPIQLLQDPALNDSTGFLYLADIFETLPGQVRFVFSATAPSGQRGWSPAYALEGQGACPAGWCVAAPIQVAAGQPLAGTRVGVDPAFQDGSQLATGVVELIGQPGDIVTVQSLDAAGLILGSTQINNAGLGTIFVFNPPNAENRLFEVNSGLGATRYYFPREGIPAGSLEGIDFNNDGFADTLELTEEPTRIHLLAGNPGGGSAERNHLYEMVLEEDDYGHILNWDQVLGHDVTRIGDGPEDFTRLLGSNPPLYVQNIRDLNGDASPQEGVVIRRDQGQPDYSVEFIQGIPGAPFPAQIFQVPNGEVPVQYLVTDYDLDGDEDVCIQLIDELPLVFVNDGVGNFNPLAGPLYLGTGEDFKDEISVNGGLPTCSGIVEASAGDIVSVFACSPNHTFDFLPYALLAQEFTPGSPPPGIPFLGVAVSPGGTPAPFALINGGAPTPLGPLEVVLPGGNLHNFLIPPGLSGQSLMTQSIVLTPMANNGFFAAAFGTEVRFN